VPETVSVNVDRQCHVAVVEFRRPPLNYFTSELIGKIADAYEALDEDPECRALVLAAAGRHFCAGADFHGESAQAFSTAALYEQGLRLFAARKPVVAAVQGCAIGGGLGLALSADFRVATPSTQFRCSFARLGIHHGFGMTVTLPAAVGRQNASLLLYSGGRVTGQEAKAMQLCDLVVVEDELRSAAVTLASEIAAAAPLAVGGIRETMRCGLYEQVKEAMAIENAKQDRCRATSDFAEGVRAMHERRIPTFTGV
jgi:enoyl-CoA hydratase/carnithine racemase